MKSVGDRIRAARIEKKISQNALANGCGWEDMQARISNYENGRTEPAYSDLVKIADVLGVDPAYLAFGTENSPIISRFSGGIGNLGRKDLELQDSLRLRKPKSHEFEYLQTEIEPWDSGTPLDDDEVEIPYFTDVEVAAGDGSMLANERIGPKLRFAKSTLRRAGVEPESAACVKVSGNSMEPAFRDGGVVGVNTADKNVRDGQVYAIDHGGLLRIKVLQNLPHGGLKLKSYNQVEYPDESLTPEEAGSLRVIGRVFWYSVLF